MILKNLKNSIVFMISFTCSLSANASSFHTDDSLRNHDKNPTIIAAVPAFFPPFYQTDNEGLPYGMAIEVLNEIDHIAGYRTKYIVKNSWSDVFNAIKSGEAQIIPNLGITKERKKQYFFSQPYAKTDITVFTRPDNKIKSEEKLTNLQIGVVNKNIGMKIAQQNKYNNVHTYESINLAFQALIDKKVDAIIYPKLIAIKVANQLKIKHLVQDTNITLKTIHRALAVSKKHPLLYRELNVALKKYMLTQDYRDTYTSWYGKDKTLFSKTHLILINFIVLLFTVLIFNYFWRKKNFSVFNNSKSNSNTLWVVTLMLILITSTTIVTLSTLWIIYETSFNEQRLRLIDSVKSRARLIEAIARYDKEESKLHSRDLSVSHRHTIGQIVDAHEKFAGFGETGEFTLAKKDNNQIKFILRQRHSRLVVPKPISFTTTLAAPMRLALLGHSGTIVGKDYRGEQVLAAYEPVSILKLGIVAKIDIEEIRAPFILSALYILIVVILVSLAGSLLFFYIVVPVIKKNKETEQRFQNLFQNNSSPIILVDPKNAIIKDVNNAAIEFYGYNLNELLSYNLDVLSIDPELKIVKQLNDSVENNYESLITKHRLQNGKIRDIEIVMSPIEFDNETIIYCIMVDITEKVKKDFGYQQLQKDLEQARKMEALGQLTGGIAHDFNNILGIIMGYTELSQVTLSGGAENKVLDYLDNVTTASLRAKELISSMMVFSRTDEGEYKALNIYSLVKEDLKMMRSIIPTSIDITTHINEEVPAVLMEPVKLQQLLMNLCVNARDAMDGQGKLSISLDYQKNINTSCLICYEHIEGDWVKLSVTDTGSGMGEDTIRRIFEPFFTTKVKGKGTGMGMAVVHGIVQDLNGHITIDSELGKGTSINIFLKPVEITDDSNDVDQELTLSNEKHSEKILVVDDEKSISTMLGDMLEIYGYQCTCLFSSEQALTEFSYTPDQFDLIISDQTMPNMTGLEMVKKMRIIRPDIPAIIATGYSDSINESIASDNDIELMKKPLSKDNLIRTVINILKNE